MAKGKSFGSFEKAMQHLKGSEQVNQTEGIGKVLRNALTEQAQAQPDTSTRVVPEKKALDVKTGLESADKEIFDRIVDFAELREGSDSYWRVRDLIRDSHKQDVSFNISRYLGNSMRHGAGKLNYGVFRDAVFAVEERGYISECREWLKSATPEGMKYGRGTREYRIDQARIFASKGRVKLEDLAGEMRITL